MTTCGDATPPAASVTVQHRPRASWSPCGPHRAPRGFVDGDLLTILALSAAFWAGFAVQAAFHRQDRLEMEAQIAEASLGFNGFAVTDHDGVPLACSCFAPKAVAP